MNTDNIQLSDKHLTETCKDIIAVLLRHDSSFIVKYPEPRSGDANTWFAVTSPGAGWSSAIPDEVGEYLVKNAWVSPELSDAEYKVQIALGSIDCRVYKNSNKNNKEK